MHANSFGNVHWLILYVIYFDIIFIDVCYIDIKLENVFNAASNNYCYLCAQ